MKNFSGVCQAAGADKPLRAFFIWITNIVTLHYTMALKSPRTAMILTIVIIVVTFLVVVSVMLAHWPKDISVNENDQIKLSTYIGKPQLIPVDEISITEMPEGMLNHLIRTNGMSLGKINYGHFKNTKTGQKMFLYLTGKESKICFTYNGVLYVVDDWRQ